MRISGVKALHNKQVAATSMVKPEDITGMAMSLRVEEDFSLFALLAADGAINRFGSGAIEISEEEVFIGVVSDPKPCQNLRAQISPDLFNWIGDRASPNPKGKVCELTIYLFCQTKKSLSFTLNMVPNPNGLRQKFANWSTQQLSSQIHAYEECKAGVANQRK